MSYITINDAITKTGVKRESPANVIALLCGIEFIFAI